MKKLMMLVIVCTVLSVALSGCGDSGYIAVSDGTNGTTSGTIRVSTSGTNAGSTNSTTTGQK